MNSGCDAVLYGGLSVLRASKIYGVPENTLRDFVKERRAKMLEQSTDTGMASGTEHNACAVDDKVKEIRQNAVFICDNGFTENVEKSLEMQTESDLNIVKP